MGGTNSVFIHFRRSPVIATFPNHRVAFQFCFEVAAETTAAKREHDLRLL